MHGCFRPWCRGWVTRELLETCTYVSKRYGLMFLAMAIQTFGISFLVTAILVDGYSMGVVGLCFAPPGPSPAPSQRLSASTAGSARSYPRRLRWELPSMRNREQQSTLVLGGLVVWSDANRAAWPTAAMRGRRRGMVAVTSSKDGWLQGQRESTM